MAAAGNGEGAVGTPRLRLGMVGGGRSACIGGLHRYAARLDGAYEVVASAFDVDAHVMLRSDGGARGLQWSSQAAAGCSNGLRLRVFGETASLSWFQEEPDVLHHARLDGRPAVIKRGREDLDGAARARTRTPPGHPEGHIEAFANLYLGFAEAIRARRDGREPGIAGRNVPTGRDGLKGVAFVDAVADGHEGGQPRWITPAHV